MSHKLLFIAASALVLGCGNAKAKDDVPVAEPPGAVEHALEGRRVEVAVVQPSVRHLTISVPGEVEGFRDAALAAPLGGYIEGVSVREGEMVPKGKVLASVDSATHGARLRRGKVELLSAQRELERAEALSGTIPKAEIDAARDRVSLIEAGAKELALNASRTSIRAPFAGYIARVDAEVGEVAAPGAVLIRLVQLTPVKVSVALSDRDVALAKKGARARVQVDARSGVFEGTITDISKAADMKTRSFEAIIEVPNEQETLLPGMIANVTLETHDTATTTVEGADKGPAPKGGKGSEPESDVPPTDQLVISQDWLVTKPDGVGVFVERGGKANWQSVELGDVLRTQVVVTKGLNAGDALIIVGHRELVDGDPVLVHRRGLCCTQGRVSFEQ